MPVENNLVALSFLRSIYESRSTKFCSLDLQETLACLFFFNWHTRVIKRRFNFPRDINNYFPQHIKFLQIVEYLRARGIFRGIIPPTNSSEAINAGGMYPISSSPFEEL